MGFKAVFLIGVCAAPIGENRGPGAWSGAWRAVMGFDQIRQRRLSDDIVEQLEGMILEGTLKSGERLPAERALAEQFGVSRPSLREAIQKLVGQGAAGQSPGRRQLCGDIAGLDLSVIPCCSCWKATLKPSVICWNFVIRLKRLALITRPCVRPRWIASGCGWPLSGCRTVIRGLMKSVAQKRGRPMPTSTWPLPKRAITRCCCIRFAGYSTCSSATW
jgi:hypothetical protein